MRHNQAAHLDAARHLLQMHDLLSHHAMHDQLGGTLRANGVHVPTALLMLACGCLLLCQQRAA